ncbi:MAG: tetratricopeptide repeat protein, partial [Candidatus Latescibacterota bacterium]|nr:tetratricopeptide repeat protein [Candidatus Latescibacterota bacterium]
RWTQAVEWIAPLAGAAQDAGYYRVLASAYDHLDQPDDALLALKSAIELQPEDAELLGDVAGIYLRRDDYSTASGYLEKAFALSPEDNLLGYNYAISLMRIEDEPRALEVLEAVVANDDQFADGWALLSQLYLRADRIKEGQAAYDLAESLRDQ